jgi:hypothetical protein
MQMQSTSSRLVFQLKAVPRETKVVVYDRRRVKPDHRDLDNSVRIVLRWLLYFYGSTCLAAGGRHSEQHGRQKKSSTKAEMISTHGSSYEVTDRFCSKTVIALKTEYEASA